jgi:hypothetical protein
MEEIHRRFVRVRVIEQLELGSVCVGRCSLDFDTTPVDVVDFLISVSFSSFSVF